MNYQIIYNKPALKFLRKQTPEQQRRLVTAIHKLPERGKMPFSRFCSKNDARKEKQPQIC